MPGMKIDIGRIVKYVDINGKELPAVITHVWSQETGCANLQIFRDDSDGSYLKTSVVYSNKEGNFGTWHWQGDPYTTIGEVSDAMRK